MGFSLDLTVPLVLLVLPLCRHPSTPIMATRPQTGFAGKLQGTGDMCLTYLGKK